MATNKLKGKSVKSKWRIDRKLIDSINVVFEYVDVKKINRRFQNDKNIIRVYVSLYFTKK
ncbi:hypothetical protein [Virgibacillus ndiopensis]|uniref:hypothetical protein n=1 Tax=Virgibacillus ndiopensis TaxID=2004408 RepID=UPI000C0735D9|nr:hypothetical protein [Virgibacillus ndiopensis]